MAWRQVTDSIGSRLMEGEREALNAAGGSDKLLTRAADAVAMFVGAMKGAGYEVAEDGSVPDQLRNHVMSVARQELLQDFPELAKYQTNERKAAYVEAQRVLEKIVLREYGAIEPPGEWTDSKGQKHYPRNHQFSSWNSENRLIMRTHPIPPPLEQISVYPNNEPPFPPYANPKAAPDTVPEHHHHHKKS